MVDSQSSPRSEKMRDSKEAMVRWLKVQDAPFGSFHGENFFHGASGSSGTFIQLNTAQLHNYHPSNLTALALVITGGAWEVSDLSLLQREKKTKTLPGISAGV